MSVKDIITRTTVANVVAAFITIAGMLFFIYTGNKDGVLLLTGAAVGWLFKEVKAVI